MRAPLNQRANINMQRRAIAPSSRGCAGRWLYHFDQRFVATVVSHSTARRVSHSLYDTTIISETGTQQILSVVQHIISAVTNVPLHPILPTTKGWLRYGDLAWIELGSACWASKTGRRVCMVEGRVQALMGLCTGVYCSSLTNCGCSHTAVHWRRCSLRLSHKLLGQIGSRVKLSEKRRPGRVARPAPKTVALRRRMPRPRAANGWSEWYSTRQA
jgi:hypothetical protein